MNATYYFRIYKFYNHLKILEGQLQNNLDLVQARIEEGHRIKEKMGFWGSMFNLAFFLNEYAEVLINLKRAGQALELLKETVEYNPNYPACHINLAKIHLDRNEMEKARTNYQKAQELLADSNKDFTLVSELEKIRKRLSTSSISN